MSMYAIVEVLGKQLRVCKSQEVIVPKMSDAVGSNIVLDKVLAGNNGKVFKVGNPYIANASVCGTVMEHIKDRKVLIFKKKRRVGYQKRQGHRQQYTKVLIEDIILK